jgi:acetylornithine aminotransferase
MTAACLMNTYKPLPLNLIKGLGARLWDDSGRQYVDALAGVAVTNVGHAHPRIVAAISEQAGLLLHVSNHYRVDWQQRLAHKLTQISGLDQVFFNNSGAEANETALKLARLHGWSRGIERPLIVVMENAFHGRTLGTLSASDNESVRLGFQTMSNEFVKVPFGDMDAIEAVARAYGERVVAVMLEPIQGEGGVVLPPAGYLKAVRDYCSRRNWLMIVDEIQTGIGRTGQWFACQHEAVVPDVMTLAKALGNGIPIGACLASAAVAKLFTPGSHGSTFGGNPLACRVGCTVLEIIEEQGLLNNASVMGERLLSGLRQALEGHPRVREVRGLGLMIAVELNTPLRDLTLIAARDHGVLINVTRGQVIRLLPPLIIDDTEVQMIVSAITQAIAVESLP